MSEKKNISKKELRRRKRKRALMIKTGILCVLLVIFGIGIWALAGGTEKIQQKAQEKEDQKTAEVDGTASLRRIRTAFSRKKSCCRCKRTNLSVCRCCSYNIIHVSLLFLTFSFFSCYDINTFALRSRRILCECIVGRYKLHACLFQ